MYKEKVLVDSERAIDWTSHSHRLNYLEKEQLRRAKWWRRLFQRFEGSGHPPGGRIEIPRRKSLG